MFDTGKTSGQLTHIPVQLLPQMMGNRPDQTLVDGKIIDLDHRHDFERGGGDEDLVGELQILKLDLCRTPKK